MQWFRQFLRLTKQDLASAEPALWQQSVLRIILLSGLALVLVIVLHSSWQAWQQGSYHIIAITCSFYISLLAALYLSRHHTKAGAVALLGVVIGAGLCMSLFIDDFSLAKLGVIFVYTLPMISLMFFGLRAAVFFMLLNLVPFGYMVWLNQPLHLTPWSFTLPDTALYLHGLLFLFFNLCMPLAFARIFGTLRRTSRRLGVLNLQLEQSHNYYEELFENNGSATMLVHSTGEVIKANGLARKLLQCETEPLRLDQLLQTQAGPLDPAHWAEDKIECQLQADPNHYMQLKHVIRTSSGHHILNLQDITPLKRLQQQFEQHQQKLDVWQHYDSLTSLPNRAGFLELGTQRLSTLQLNQFALVVIVRLCHVKTLNQQYGYDFGSRLMQRFAEKSRTVLPADAVLARVRGVKFAIWMQANLNATDPVHLAQMLCSNLPSEIRIDGFPARMHYQFGLAVARLTTDEPLVLLERCELALEQSNPAQPLSFYDPGSALKLEQDYRLGNALRDALRLHQLELHLQPKVSPTGELQSFEALSRWSPNGEVVTPDRFIALAEQQGIIVQFSRCVLQQAVRLLQDWQERGWVYPVAVNLAGPELLDDSFFAELMSLGADLSWLTSQLQLEITETNIAVQHPTLHKRLKALSQYGFSISIDDFGTGHSSLSQLVDCAADTLKIDRRFVRAVPQDSRTVRILHTTVQLAKTLDLKLVAEGVELDVQRRFLQTLGCQQLQGYLFSAPQPICYWQQLLSQNPTPNLLHRESTQPQPA